MEPFPSLSGRLVRPFAVVLARDLRFRRTVELLRKLQPEDRPDVQRAFDAVARWVEQSGDVDLGLKAALEMEIGRAGILDYAMRSASCLRDAFTLVQDYGWHFSESLQLDWVEERQQIIVQFAHNPSSPRAVMDFTLGTWFRSYLRAQLEGVSSIDCYFSYAQPESISLHRRVFTDAALHFGAQFDGFAFDKRGFDVDLPATSPMLHVLHCGLLERGLTNRHAHMPTAARVRELVASELRHGRPTATAIARRLHMSRRTLVRRLVREGTSFSRVLSDVRHALALRYTAMEALPISQVSSLLGFAHTQAFHRCFRRWTGTTPMQYRMDARATHLR
jgi:AraC-like DNA-binding protein